MDPLRAARQVHQAKINLLREMPAPGVKYLGASTGMWEAKQSKLPNSRGRQRFKPVGVTRGIHAFVYGS